MKISITLDYELFFGCSTGTVEACLLLPTEALLKKLDPMGAKVTFFVDAGYLSRSAELGVDLENRKKVIDQLRLIISDGHDVQLHVHPHWEDCSYRNGEWCMDTTRFKLIDFRQSKASEIINKYAAVLNNELKITVCAFRAGGWCIQPFDHIKNALVQCGIIYDTTIFNGGVNNSKTHYFNFSSSPSKASYLFEDDPCIEVDSGSFMELPIADVKVSPFFFLKMFLAKKLGGARHIPYGNGRAISLSKKDTVRLLTSYSYSVVSIDGYKSSLLDYSARRWAAKYGERAPMVIIGHPKAFTNYSLGQVESFVKKIGGDNFVSIPTLADYVKK